MQHHDGIPRGRCCNGNHLIWGFPWGYPNSWMVCKGKSHLEMDDNEGYPHFRISLELTYLYLKSQTNECGKAKYRRLMRLICVIRLRIFLRWLTWPFQGTPRFLYIFFCKLTLAIHPAIYPKIFQGILLYPSIRLSIYKYKHFFCKSPHHISFCQQRSHGPVSEAARARGLATKARCSKMVNLRR